jgi:hypothetical protein
MSIAPTRGFTVTGSMVSGREGFTATLLADGRVLVAGGTLSTSYDMGSNSAELYDPAVGRFTATGSMAISREHQTATLLPDGKVLLAGGDPAESAIGELYDPATGKFAVTGPMRSARMYATATLLANGKVLLVGGFNGGKTLASAELFDPSSGTFGPTGSMRVAREDHTATLLADGRVLVVGGDRGMSDPTADSSSAYASSEIYDPGTGAFTPAGSMDDVRSGASAMRLPSGLVLEFGGQDAERAPLDSVEVFNPASGTWARVGVLNGPAWKPTIALLNDGRVLVLGAGPDQVFDPVSGSFDDAAGPRCPATGAYETATTLTAGPVLVLKGDQPSACVYWS